MADLLTKHQRSDLMAKIRSGDTKPEWILRSGLHRLGFRFILNNRQLPGCPDLVFPKYGTVVFVHGCFWHRHADCKHSTIPKTNTSFWDAKLSGNVERDIRTTETLSRQGWRVMVVWECDLEERTLETITQAAAELRSYSNEPMDCMDNYFTKADIIRVAEQKVRYRIRRERLPAR